MPAPDLQIHPDDLKHHRLGRGALLIALLLLIACGCGFVPGWLLTHLQQGLPQDFTDWGQRNAIVLLGAGTTAVPDSAPLPSTLAYSRILKVLELYRDCKHRSGRQCLLLVSGGNPQRHTLSEAGSYARELLRLGVQRNDLQLETHSLTTRQNAQFSRPLLVAAAPNRIVLVSSAFHLYRACLDFRQFGLPVQPVAADYIAVERSWLPDAGNLLLTGLALHEYAGMAQFYLYRLWDRL